MSYKPTVAVLGSSGFLGEPVLKAFSADYLKDKIQFPVKALTRDIKTKRDSDKVAFVEGNLDVTSKERIIQEFTGVDVIIELITPDVQLFNIVESIVSSVKPKLFIPSQFGAELSKVDKYLPGFLGAKTDHSNNIRKLGVKVVDVVTGYFALEDAFLYEIVGGVGIDAEHKTVTYAGSPQTPIAISKLPDIGYAVATLSTIPPSELSDTIRIQSQQVTFEDVVKRYEQNHNVVLKVNNTTKEDILKDAQSRFKTKFELKDFLFYLHAIAAQGVDQGLSFSKVDNELVNPKQQSWSWGSF